MEWQSSVPAIAAMFVLNGLLDLYRADEVLADHDCARFSLNSAYKNREGHETEFDLFSDKMERLYPGYLIDDMCRVRPGPNTPTVNLKWLQELLKSKDLERNAELSWVSPKTLRFLDGEDTTG